MKTFWMVLMFLLALAGCNNDKPKKAEQEDPQFREISGIGGVNSFKVPLARGFNWEVSQSWADHCEGCERRYPDWNYCNLSHMGNCCRHSIDFNLPGDADLGKPVLASADGTVKESGFNNGWGYYVLLDHGGDICTRYGHMLAGSNAVVAAGQQVCQGLKIGEIGNTGSSEGPHLHFQFESCKTGESLPRGFTDGNEVPMCTRGQDVLDANGDYNFLELSNSLRHDCGGEEGAISGGGELPEGGWLRAQCGSLPGCPLVPNCGRGFNHEFTDHHYLEADVKKAAIYLWSECALDGKEDGGVYQYDWITRAEALKISLYLFGLMEECGVAVPFRDVPEQSWYFPIIACAVKHRLVNHGAALFYPNREVTYAEAAKLVVGPAVMAGVIELVEPGSGHFRNINSNHWAYPYVETLYTYGGIIEDPDEIQPDDPVQRREYIMMASALSPCYCGNVRCHRECQCEQEVYACVDPNNNDPGVGGDLPESSESSEPESPEEREDDREEPSEEPPRREERDAGATPPPRERPDAAVIEEEPRENQPEPAPAEPEDREDPPQEPPPEPQEEEPCVAYRVEFKAPGGWLQAQSSGQNPDYHEYHFMADEDYWLTFRCEEVPAAILLHSDESGYTRVRVTNEFPEFLAWYEYEGELTLNPDREPDIQVRGMHNYGPPNNSTLILLP